MPLSSSQSTAAAGAPVTVPIEVQRVHRSRRSSLDLSSVPFSSVMSDHMLVATFENQEWREARVQPYRPLELLPGISAIQYGVSVFEGLKARRGDTGEVLLFRVEENAKRMARSAERLAMPPVPDGLFLDGITALLQADESWVPNGNEGALYIRPCLFSTDASIRPRPADRFLFVAITFPFGNYFPPSVDAYVTERFVRAFPGGTGDIKAAGNYAAALLADREALAMGCQTVLWLDGIHREFIEECGVMNVFFVIDDTVVTPSLEGTILPGITRDSVITLLRDRGIEVEERRIGIGEVVAAHEQGRLRECFGTGTAATLSHIARIRYREQDLILPAVAEHAIGPGIRDALVAIAAGRAPDGHGWVTRLGDPGLDSRTRTRT